MRYQGYLASLAAVLASASLVQSLQQRAVDDDTPELRELEDVSPIIPGRYIVEFESTAHRKEAAQTLDSLQGLKINRVFGNSDLFFGASVEVSDDEDVVSVLMSDASVARVWPLRKVKLITSVAQQNFSEIVDALDYNIHGPTGVEAMHKAGIYGEGATVAVVDTGIEYTHPGIGGGIGPDYTVIGGADLVGDGCWPAEGCPRQPDDDPMDYQGHGTHVAGIIAGKSKWFTGVAPKAKLLAYKVFTQEGWVLEDVLIESFLMAYENDADVITASIGALSGWQDSAWAVVSDRIVEKGVVVTIAAGNNGDAGPFMFSDGSAGRNVLGVASSEPDYVPQTALEISLTDNGTTNETKMGHLPRSGIPWPQSIDGWPVVHVGSGCQLPSGLNLTGKVALVERWFCSPVDKEENILGAGGKYIFIFDPVEPDRDGWYLGEWNEIIFAALAEKDGQALAAALGEGYQVNVTVPEEQTIIGMPNHFAGTPSYFTSFGPTYDHAVKPDISAPGGGILSLYLDNSFAGMSGTSMATPYVAGVAALYIGKHGGRSKHGDDFAKMLSARILSSGSHVTWSDHMNMPFDSGLQATVAQAGNGLVNATKVLTSHTQLSFTKFALNDTHRFSRYQEVEITNNSPDFVTYKFDVKASGGFETLRWSAEGHPHIPGHRHMINDVVDIVPEVRMPAGTQRLAPGQSKKVEFIFKIPEGMNYKNMPVYSGKILVMGSNGDEVSIPYLGVGGNTGKEERNQVWYRDLRYPRVYSGYDDKIEDMNSFTFNLSLVAQSFPKVEAVVNYGSPELRWDIFEEDWREHKWKYPPVPGKDGYVGSVTCWAGANTGIGAVFDPNYDSQDDLRPLPLEKITRNVIYPLWWLGRLANGSDIAPGKYHLRIAVLAPFGNPQASDNWDRHKTPMIEVLAE